MAERRSLAAGLNAGSQVDPGLEKDFVYGRKESPSEAIRPAATEHGKPKTPKPASLVPLTSRVREDIAVALKRASLQRQLDGQVPNTLQDILEDALEPWLRSHGYLS